MKARRVSGFSLTELVVAMAVAMVLMAVALPSFLRAYHSYQLSNAATQMADIVRLTRYEAIRLNKSVNCLVRPDSANPTMTDALMTDVNGTPMTGVSSRMVMLGPSGNLVDAGSWAAGLPTAAQLGASTPAAFPSGGGAIQFDARGAQVPSNVTAFYLAAPGSPESGFRAVLLMPAGSIQIWAADTAGKWRQMR
jgi:Tfp pilus assembly protein FimT